METTVLVQGLGFRKCPPQLPDPSSAALGCTVPAPSTSPGSLPCGCWSLSAGGIAVTHKTNAQLDGFPSGRQAAAMITYCHIAASAPPWGYLEGGKGLYPVGDFTKNPLL